MKKRDPKIETLRGLACVLLVAFHVVGDTKNSGLTLSSGLLREMNDLLALIRMPLFTFISGYVYAYRPYSAPWQPYVAGKARRLLIPMLIVGTLFAIIQSAIPGTNARVENWYLLHIIPHAHFWFLESLFLVFLVLIPLENAAILKTRSGLLCTLIAASGLFLAAPQFPYFGVSGAIYLFPFFLCGLYFSRFSQRSIDFSKLALPLLTLVLLVIVYLFPNEVDHSRHSVAALVIGLLGCTALLQQGWENSLLARIGQYSYSIYLYHVFFSAGSRILTRSFQQTPIEVLFVVGLICGILGPIVVDHFFSRTQPTKVLLLGKR